MLPYITPIVLTYNEEANIRRTLSALSWAQDVLVVDSYSDDATLAICTEFPNVRVIQRAFDDSASQCNFALAQDIETEWVLSMDADYVVTAELVAELAEKIPAADINGYQVSFDYLIDGIRLRGSLYPPRTALYRKQYASYWQDGHTQRVRVSGKSANLHGKVQHDDRKPYDRWLGSQKRYAELEASKLAMAPWTQLSLVNKLRKLGIAPLVVVPYTLLIKALILNGRAGIKYTAQRFIAEWQLQKARFRQLRS